MEESSAVVTHHHIGTPSSSDEEHEEPADNKWGETWNEWKLHVPDRTCPYAIFYRTNTSGKYQSTYNQTGSAFDAVLVGDINWLYAFVNAGGSWDVTGMDRMTLMHYACVMSTSRIPVVELLLAKMKRPQIPDATGITPIAITCRYGNLEIAKILISNGAIITSIDRRGFTCLHEAAMFGQSHCIKYLLDLVTSERYRVLLSHAVWLKSVSGKTCYDIAVDRGFVECAELILRYMKSDIFKGQSPPTYSHPPVP